MPRSLLVVANPSAQSFSHAMAAAASQALRERGHELATHDLYAERVGRFERRVFGPVASSTPQERTAWLDEVRGVVARHA